MLADIVHNRGVSSASEVSEGRMPWAFVESCGHHTHMHAWASLVCTHMHTQTRTHTGYTHTERHTDTCALVHTWTHTRKYSTYFKSCSYKLAEKAVLKLVVVCMTIWKGDCVHLSLFSYAHPVNNTHRHGPTTRMALAGVVYTRWVSLAPNPQLKAINTYDFLSTCTCFCI